MAAKGQSLVGEITSLKEKLQMAENLKEVTVLQVKRPFFQLLLARLVLKYVLTFLLLVLSPGLFKIAPCSVFLCSHLDVMVLRKAGILLISLAFDAANFSLL